MVIVPKYAGMCFARYTKLDATRYASHCRKKISRRPSFIRRGGTSGLLLKSLYARPQNEDTMLYSPDLRSVQVRRSIIICDICDVHRTTSWEPGPISFIHQPFSCRAQLETGVRNGDMGSVIRALGGSSATRRMAPDKIPFALTAHHFARQARTERARHLPIYVDDARAPGGF